MKLTILQENLKRSLRILQNAIPGKPQLPILSSIFCQIKDKEMTLAATDLYLGIKTKAKIQSTKSLQFVVPGETFKQLVFSFDPGEIELEKKENSLKIKTAGSKTSIPVQNAADYPDFPEVDGEKFTLETEALEKIKTLVSFAASSDQARPVLTTALLSFSQEGLEVVATDGFRLAVLNFPELSSKTEKKLLVPVKALNEVCRVVGQLEVKTVDLQVAPQLKQVRFVAQDTEIFVRLIDGDYPPYEKIVPTSFARQIELDGQALKEELQRAYILAKEASNIVKLELDKDLLKVSSSTSAFGDYQGELNVANPEGSSAEIAFNALYLLDFLSSTKPESVWLGMNESLKPAMFRVKDQPNYYYIAMPFRMNE